MLLNLTTGASLLIAGTTIGAVTLALPIATAKIGLLGVLILFLSAWMVMYISGLILAEVCVNYPPGTSFVTLAKNNFGYIGQLIAWVSYGVLLITLLMAYFSSLSSLIDFNNVFFDDRRIGNTLVALVVWLVVSMGTEFIDAMNRLMVYVLVVTIVLMMMVLFMHTNHSPWLTIKPTISGMGHLLPIIVAGFGFQVILPSVRTYLNGHEERLPNAVLYGSLLPLIIYIFWTVGVLIGLKQKDLLELANFSDETVAISVLLQSLVHRFIINLFIFAAVVSSLLGIALSLKDFITDAFKMKSNWLPSLLTVLIPWMIVNIHPAAFLEILRFGGFIVAILNILFPSLILLKERMGYGPSHQLIAPSNGVVYGVIIYAVFVIFAEIFY